MHAPNPLRGRSGVVGLVFVLMLVDFIDRQILVSMYPHLKVEWQLTDTELGALAAVVALAIGAFSIPVSLWVARWNRARVLGVMAMVWSVATLLGAFVTSYGQLLATRILVGIGQAGYAPIAGTLVTDHSAPQRHCTALGSLLATTIFGTVLGVYLGGLLAGRLNWRAGLVIVGSVSLILALALCFLRDTRSLDACREQSPGTADAPDATWRSFLLSPVLLLTYAGYTLLSMLAGTVVAWSPSYFHRAFELPVDTAGLVAAVLLACSGIGAMALAWALDRTRAHEQHHRLRAAAASCLLSSSLFAAGLGLDPGGMQLLMLFAAGVFLLGHLGPLLAVVIGLPAPRFRAVAIAILVTTQNLAGLAVGPLLAGILSDRFGLAFGMQCVAVAGPLAAAAFLGAAFIHVRGGSHAAPASSQGAIS